MSDEKPFNFNDLNDFCDKIIFETQKWRDILQIQTEDYTKLIQNNEDACAKLWEVHQKVNVLSFLQEKIQRDLCESESNYNAMLKRVEELEDEMIENRNCTVNPHYSLYETAAYINTSLNNLETFVEDVNGRIQNLETEKEKNAKSSCELLIAKQLELLESLERKMFYLRNEMQRIEKMQQEITHAINEPKHKKWF